MVLSIKDKVDHIRSLNKPNITIKDSVIYWDGPDLCTSGHSLCPHHSLCINTLDSFTCVCQHGYYDISSAIESPAASQPTCKENGLFSHCRSKLMIGGVAKPYLTSQIGGKMEVKLNNGQCNLNESETMIFFRTSRRVSECGTEKQVNKTHIKFQNTLTVILTKEETISRRDLKVVWKCIYPRHYVRNAQVSVDKEWFSSISLVEFNSSLQLGLTMTLHTDETYSSSYTDVIHLGPDDSLFFEVALQTNAYFVLDLLLQVDSCWATESSDPQDPVQAVFLQDGCPVDATFRWHVVKELDQRSRFSLQLFTMPEGLPLYFHCLTNICGREENCTESCSGAPRSRRSVIEEERKSRRGAVVSVGPLLVTGKNLVEPSHSADHVIIISTVATLIGVLGLTVLSVISAKAIMMYYEQLRVE
uniref:ZP domain-containing protein n=2 Tax=Gouania willdenowi TaxID=441366 RepID=A0A8C5NDB3_GOUWI